MSVPALTVVVLTHNEAGRIRRCLSSVPLHCRVVVVDSFSTDQTLREAKRTWEDLRRAPQDLALVQTAWEGFTRTRNKSLNWVQTPYVFWLDADEWMSPELAEELRHPPAWPLDEKIFRVPRQSYFLGRPIRHGGWYPDRKSRLARTADVEWQSGPSGADVHEDLVTKDPAFQRPPKKRFCLQGHLHHEGFKDRAEQMETNRRYSALLAQGLAQKFRAQGRRAPGPFWTGLKVLIKFVENYIFKRGFLDGYPGLLIALGSAQSLKMRYEKLRDYLR